jgi:hypothetical protein
MRIQRAGLLAVRSAAAEGVNGASTGCGFASMQHTLGDEIFLSGFYWNVLAIDDQVVAALNDQHVFVEVVDMRLGCGGLAAGLEGHLAAVYAVEYVSFDSRGGLTARRDFVCRALHEVWEFIHRRSFRSLPHSTENADPSSARADSG